MRPLPFTPYKKPRRYRDIPQDWGKSSCVVEYLDDGVVEYCASWQGKVQVKGKAATREEAHAKMGQEIARILRS